MPESVLELRLDEAEEDRIARVFRAITPRRLFTFEIRDLPRQELAPPEDQLHHLVVAFDQVIARKPRGEALTVSGALCSAPPACFCLPRLRQQTG